MLPHARHLLSCIGKTQAPFFTQLYILPIGCIKVYFVGVASDPKLKIWVFFMWRVSISQLLPELESNSVSMFYPFKYQIKPNFRMWYCARDR